jgi:hypothetical protein
MDDLAIVESTIGLISSLKTFLTPQWNAGTRMGRHHGGKMPDCQENVIDHTA